FAVRVSAIRLLDRPGLLLRLAADVGRHRQAPVHHARYAGADLPDPARRDVDDGDDPAARRAELDAAASPGLPGRSLRRAPLHLAGESWSEGSVLVRGRARAAARRARAGGGPAWLPPPRRARCELGAGRLVGGKALFSERPAP